MFAYNTEATEFVDCFSDCVSLTSLPDGLFAKNTKVKSFSGCFSGCTALKEIPYGLFDTNTEVTSFTRTFSGCTALKSAPKLLFAKNLLATNFFQCFKGCTSMCLNEHIFCEVNPFNKSSRFADKTMNFSSCFENCCSDSSIEATTGGRAPSLWEYTMGTESIYANCFSGCTNASNYENVPPEWGGPIKTNH